MLFPSTTAEMHRVVMLHHRHHHQDECARGTVSRRRHAGGHPDPHLGTYVVKGAVVQEDHLPGDPLRHRPR